MLCRLFWPSVPARDLQSLRATSATSYQVDAPYIFQLIGNLFNSVTQMVRKSTNSLQVYYCLASNHIIAPNDVRTIQRIHKKCF